MFPIGLIFANVAGAVDLIYNKYILAKLRVPYRAFLVVAFFFAFIFCVILFPFWGSFNISQISSPYLWLFLLMVALALMHNFLLQRALRTENINEIELYYLLTPIATILAASALLPGEFTWKIFVSAFVGACALVLAHLRKRHLYFDKYTPLLLFYLVLVSLEAVTIKILLDVSSPVALYMLRCGFVFILFLFIFGAPNKGFSIGKLKNIIFISILWVVYNLFTFEAYSLLGVVETTLILLVSPVLVYLFSYIFFGEHLKKRQILATLIIIGAIVFSLF